MDTRELIALAAIRSGKKKFELGAEMGHSSKTRISDLSTGRLKPDASEIVYLAHQAKLPELQTLAEIETQRNPALAAIWKQLLSGAQTAQTW